MIDTRTIKDLLDILKTHNVKHLKMPGLELEFHMEQVISSLGQFSENHINSLTSVESDLHAHQEHQPEEDSTQIIADTIRKQEESLPVDLRADSLMDQDKILNWSSPDQNPEEPELPLTGEQPL